MKVAAYTHMRRTLRKYGPTGVGKHINNAILGLFDRPGIDLHVMTARDQLEADGSPPDTAALADLPRVVIPHRTRNLEWSWNFFGRPNADQWCRNADWVYCPAESYVAVRNSRLAVTVHDVVLLEPDLMAVEPAMRKRSVRWPWRIRLRAILRGADKVLTVSEFSRKRLIDLAGADPAKLSVVGNGVEDVFYVNEARPPAEPGYVIVIGGLATRKGADYVIALAHELNRRRSPLTIQIVGRNVEPPLLEQAKAAANIQLRGSLLDADLAELLSRAVGLYFPSRYEGFGIPALEAMASGVPAVVSGTAALPEIVGDAGIIVDPTNTSDVADRFEMLMKHPSERADWVKKGLQRAKDYRWSAVVERIVAAMDRDSV